MAIVDTLSIPMTDDGNNRQRLIVHFPTGLAVADIQAFWTAAAPELDAISGSVIGLPEVTFVLTNPGGLKANPTADHLNSRGALLNFDAANSNFSWSQYVPAVLAGLYAGGTLDTGAAAFVAWRDRMLTGHAGPPARLPSDRYGNDLSGLNGAALSFRKP